MSFFDDTEPAPRLAPETVKRPEWFGPSHGVLPVLSTQQAVLLQSSSFALVVDQFEVYPNGVTFRVVLHYQEANVDRISPLSRLAGGSDVIHYGCQLGDGTEWTNSDPLVRRDAEPVGPVVQGGGGGGNPWRSYANHWIWPLPPAGKITFVAEWPAQRLSQQSAEIDADELRDLSDKAEVLWPS